jgi:hypothetical protein
VNGKPQKKERLKKGRSSRGSFDLPNTEYAAFEKPSEDTVYDYKGLIEDHGLSYKEMAKIAKTFDMLRQTRRHSVIMIDHNNDL